LKQYISNFAPLGMLMVAKQHENFHVYYEKQVLSVRVHKRPPLINVLNHKKKLRYLPFIYLLSI